jgi:ABC-type transport system involved in multi-copper enzyme maturation permease subunit
MIWLAWRQHRKQALFTLVALAVLAALMIPTGLAMHTTFAELGMDDCARAVGDTELPRAATEACSAAIGQFSNQYGTLAAVGSLFLFVPLLVGLFWGAPLVAREVEHGTHRLVWSQGVSRRRWALVKFGLVGAASLAASAVYGLGLSWWMAPVNLTGSRFGEINFDMQGLVPIGYTLFAVALGIFAGTIWHRVLPAMAAALAGFVAMRIVVTLVARPRYLPPLTRTVPDQVGAFNPNQGGLQLAREFRDADGNPIVPDAQGNMAFDPGNTFVWERYQPADRFWLFQGIETGIFVGLALLLLYLAIRRIRRIA